MVRLSGVSIESLKLQYTVVNVGETPATIVRHETTMIAEDDKSVLQTRPDKQDCVTLVAGESKTITIQVHFDLASGHGPEYDTSFHINSDGIVKFRGIIEYVDDAGIKRRTGFLRTYNSETKRFEMDGDPNEEYED